MEDTDVQDDLLYLAELEGLGDAHLVGVALEGEGIPFKVVANTASGFDVVIPRGWGMLYVARSQVERAAQLLEEVRLDQAAARDNYDPEAEVDEPGESEFREA